MSDVRVLEEARRVMVAKRQDLATIITSGDNVGELAIGLVNIHKAIQALDEAIADTRSRPEERERIDRR
jgi:hypothetical protein